MAAYIARRGLHALLVVIGVSVVVFFVMRLTGDPTPLLLPPDAPREAVEELRHQLGFDRPLLVQFLDYMQGAVRLDFGSSLRHKESAMVLILERMPATAQLTLAALLFSVALAVPLGVYSAVRRSTLGDGLASLVGLIGQTMPTYWLGLLLIIVFAVKLRWLPSFGKGEWKHLILPAVTLGAYTMASTMRLLRSSMLEVMTQDYVKTARAKGLAERVVVYKHALRNALLPTVTVVGLQIGALLGGAVITESIFAWPGVGRFVVQAIFNRDFPVVQAAVFLISLIIVAVNFLMDFLYAWLDPRIRLT